MPANNNSQQNQEMMNMQQDAIRRVREMQRRANANLYTNQVPAPPINQRGNVEAVSPSKLNDTPTQSNDNFNFSEIIKSFNLDRDKALIILLILVLLNEGANQKTILALCYLLL